MSPTAHGGQGSWGNDHMASSGQGVSGSLLPGHTLAVGLAIKAPFCLFSEPGS